MRNFSVIMIAFFLCSGFFDLFADAEASAKSDAVIKDEAKNNSLQLELSFIGYGLSYTRYFSQHWGLGFGGHVQAFTTLATANINSEGGWYIFASCRHTVDKSSNFGMEAGKASKDSFGGSSNSGGFFTFFYEFTFGLDRARFAPRIFLGIFSEGNQLIDRISKDNSVIVFAIQPLRATFHLNW